MLHNSHRPVIDMFFFHMVYLPFPYILQPFFKRNCTFNSIHLFSLGRRAAMPAWSECVNRITIFIKLIVSIFIMFIKTAIA